MILFVITALSTLTHFIFFGHPNGVVFDEVHIGNYLTNYWQGTYFFDVHPPLAKLLLAFFGYIIGADKVNVDWTVIGNSISGAAINLRILPMVLGTLIPVLIYWIARRLDFSKLSSSAAAILVSLENSLIVASRLIVVDMFLLFFGFLSLASFLEYRRTFEYGHTRDNTQNKWFRNLMLIVSVLSSAFAIGVKWTGLAFVLLIFLMEIFRLKNERSHTFKKSISGSLKTIYPYVATTLIVYVILFAIHFSLLPKSGDGNAFMSSSFQKTLIDSPYISDPEVKAEGFFSKFTELNIRMFDASAKLTTAHQYSSKWNTWPFMIRPIFYWQTTPPNAAGPNDYIYLLGNPFTYWLGTLSIIALFIIMWRHIWKEKKAFFIGIGYVVNFIPFIFIGRVMFLYHYQSALLFSILGIVYFLDLIPEKKKVLATSILIAVIGVSFLYWSPLTYGLPINSEQLHSRMWLPSWR
jgi:dolichyl-phosphate-mannose-protein mannosyltransferase